MALLRWIMVNFGLLFGGLFLFYLFLVLRRLVILYDGLRLVPTGRDAPASVGDLPALRFLEPLLIRLPPAGAGREALVDAIWIEVEQRIGGHFSALHGYINTLILIGFAGTIFGSIGAFDEMFRRLARGQQAAEVFAASWTGGLGTALYTSLGAAAIGGVLTTLLCSRLLAGRARRLEMLVALRISELLEKEVDHDTPTC